MKYKTMLTIGVLLFVLIFTPDQVLGQTGKETIFKVQKTTDFLVDGKGSAENWSETDWVSITQRATTKRMARNIAPMPAVIKQPAQLFTRVKALYSDTGIYFLFECEDRILQATMVEDFKQLWWEDVVEIFLWPDETDDTYFEYQLSPLNHELIIRIGRDDRGRSSWLPFSYGGERQTRHETSVEGGGRNSEESITKWIAEVFMPYQLLHPANDIPPESGTRWRVNLYRNDYDTGDRTRWEWQPVDGRNHELELFGTFLFK